MPPVRKCAIDSPSSKEPLFTRSGTFPLPSSWTAISRADSLPCCIPLVKILTRDFLRRMFPMRPLCFFRLSHQYVPFPRLYAAHKFPRMDIKTAARGLHRAFPEPPAPPFQETAAPANVLCRLSAVSLIQFLLKAMT